MKDKDKKNNKKGCIPKRLKKSKRTATNPAEINSEWDFGPKSSEATTVENDYSKPSTSKESEETTLISGESNKQLSFKSISSPNIVCETKNSNLACKLSASAPNFSTTSADEEEIFTNSANSSMPRLPFWSRDEILHSSGDSQRQDTRERVIFDTDSSDFSDSSDSENSIRPWYYSNLIPIYSYDNICDECKHLSIDDNNPLDLRATESWNYRPVETDASTRNLIRSIKSLGFNISTDVKPHLSITIMNNTFCDNQPGTSSNTYNEHVILKDLFVVEKVSSTNLNSPPMEPSDNVDSSKCCDEEDRRSLNEVPHTRYPRLKLLKRAMAMFFCGLLRASKGKCLMKHKKPH